MQQQIGLVVPRGACEQEGGKEERRQERLCCPILPSADACKRDRRRSCPGHSPGTDAFGCWDRASPAQQVHSCCKRWQECKRFCLQTLRRVPRKEREAERDALILSKSFFLLREQLLRLWKMILFKPRDHVVATSYLSDWKVTLRSYHLSCRRAD